MQYTIGLRNDKEQDVPLIGRVVGDILETLDAGAKRALRLRVEGSSDITGHYPKSLIGAATFILSRVSQHPSDIILEAPALGDALQQEDLLEELPLDNSAIGLFNEGLGDALAGTVTDNVDENLLSTYADLGRVLDRGIGELVLTNGKPTSPKIVLRPIAIEKLKSIRVPKPRARTMRIAGTLNTIRHSDKAFSLVMPSGRALRGFLVEDAEGDLKKFYGRTVIVSGKVLFRSSGKVLHMQATDITGATATEAAMWAVDPMPLFGASSRLWGNKPQGPRSGINAIIGKWPIPFSDEELLKATESKE